MSTDVSLVAEQQMQAEAACRGQAQSDFSQTVEEESRCGSRQRKQAALDLLRRWRKEDAGNPDPGMPSIIQRLSLREVDVDRPYRFGT
jgi:hypothetical protein